MKCIDGCRYFIGVDADRHTMCFLMSGTMARNIIPYVGCFRGEKEPKPRCDSRHDLKQGGLFDGQ